MMHVVERKKQKGRSHELLTQRIMWFTDGSKNEKGVGTGALEGEVGRRCSLEPFATVFQAEVRAIAECARASLMHGTRKNTIVICSDSRTALMALDGFLITSKEVLI